MLVPRGAGVGSAIGFLRAPMAFEVVRSSQRPLRSADLAALNRAPAGDARRRRARWCVPAARGAGVDEADACASSGWSSCATKARATNCASRCRRASSTPRRCSACSADFEAAYQRNYGVTIPGAEVEVVTWSVTVSTAPAAVASADAAAARLPRRRPAARGRSGTRPPARRSDFAQHWRFDLAPGARLAGPALIVEHETTTVVPRGLDGRASTASATCICITTAKEHRHEPATTNPLQAIRTQVMWNRLIAVVEEQAQALLRTAFGSVAREAGDLSAGVYDVAGRMLAQAVTGTPGHVNSMAAAVGHFLQRFPIASMKAGDVFITNDPWLGTGHLFDYVVVTPVFAAGASRPVALFASTCHTIDVGGVGFSAEARSVYEEGTCIPHLRLVDGGRLNEDLMAVIQANSRNPVEARGDILSLVSSNEVGAARLVEMMAEFGIASLDALAAHILEHSRARHARRHRPAAEGPLARDDAARRLRSADHAAAPSWCTKTSASSSTTPAARRPAAAASIRRSATPTPIRCSA